MIFVILKKADRRHSKCCYRGKEGKRSDCCHIKKAKRESAVNVVILKGQSSVIILKRESTVSFIILKRQCFHTDLHPELPHGAHLHTRDGSIMV